MATLKVGMRVRVIGGETAHGREATILGPWEWPEMPRLGDWRHGASWHVSVDGRGSQSPDGIPYRKFSDELAPLTDPGSDAFIERLKKLGKEPVVLTPAELERVAGGA